jgi:hypothetical protein
VWVSAASPPDVWIHVRIIVGMVLGLSLARLVNGMTRFVQHPGRDRIDPIHLGWTVFMLSAIVHFWWYEFELSNIAAWTFELYFFVLLYAMLFVAVASLLFPDKMEEYDGFGDYFQSRRRWFYGLLTVLFLVDFIDTAIKGREHFESLGLEYPIRQTLLATGAIVAVLWGNKRFQLVFVAAALVDQVIWIGRMFNAP